MPKATLASLPVTAALFAVRKPPGITSMAVISLLKPLLLTSRLFTKQKDIERVRAAKRHKKKRPKDVDIKIGQGGTLDPLASGVLVVGVGRQATKLLGRFLDCDKVSRELNRFGTQSGYICSGIRCYSLAGIRY